MTAVRVLSCVKRVPAPGSKINVTADGLRVDDTNLGHAMSPHEECAVEEANRLAERFGGESTVLTVGPPDADEQLRYAVSIGADRGELVETDGAAVDPQRTAAAIAARIATLEEADGRFDLILFGNESADAGGFQVGVRVAHHLGRPIVNAIKGLDVDPDAGVVTARRDIDGGFEVYELPLPAVLGVKEGLNLPRYPTMRGRLASRKADVAVSVIDAAPGGQRTVRLATPPVTTSETRVLGDSAEAAPAVVDLLEELGLLV